ncbi:2OG-Fe(II) oxygenase [Streptomyces sp. NPDC050658]|uniref:2OG-Fe(II) oxygenase n=1 Tax=unclassified Streptomyces TaxID=2593676 RepID=UPI00341D2003
MTPLPAAPPAPPPLLRPEPTARHELPFRHVVFAPGSLLSAATAAQLSAAFPTSLLRSARSRRGGDKTYAVNALTLHHHGDPAPELARLDALWHSVVRELTSPDYSHRLLRLLGLPEAPVDVEIRLTEYAHGGWMSRHTDRPEKAYSQNIYLCPGWRPQWGGGLSLYASATALRPTTTFVPGDGNSLAFARSETSWHEVLPVTAQARAPRRALLVHAHWKDWKERP